MLLGVSSYLFFLDPVIGKGFNIYRVGNGFFFLKYKVVIGFIFFFFFFFFCWGGCCGEGGSTNIFGKIMRDFWAIVGDDAGDHLLKQEVSCLPSK